MIYKEDQIKNYLEILHNYTSNPIEESNLKTQFSAKCSNCENRESFTIDYGYKICEECGVANGHVLCFYDNKDFDRLFYRKKSVYQRKYYYEKKVNKIYKSINLTNKQKNKLLIKLMKIDNKTTEILNDLYNRKRMISIEYLIKKLLAEMGGESSKASKLVYLKISPQTLDNYENWWDSYKSLKTG